MTESKVDHAMFRRAKRHGEITPVEQSLMNAIALWPADRPVIKLRWNGSEWVDITGEQSTFKAHIRATWTPEAFMSITLSADALTALREIVDVSTKRPDDPPDVVLGEIDRMPRDYEKNADLIELRLHSFITRIWRYGVFQDDDRWQFIICTGTGRRWLAAYEKEQQINGNA